MKKLNLFTLMLFSILLISGLSHAVSAAGFTYTGLSFTGTSNDVGRTITSSFVVTNNETVQLEMSLNTINVPSQYSITFSQNSFILAPGASRTITSTINVPSNYNNGLIGTFGIMATYPNDQTLTHTNNVNLNIQGGLEITRVKVEVDGDSSSLDDGEDVEAKPGDDVTIEVTVKNTFTTNNDIEDITVYLEQDDDLDWDEEEDISDLDDGDRDTAIFELSIPEDADEDDYDVDIRVEGEDENGVNYEYEYTITIEVNREKHDLRVVSVKATPQTVSCDRSISLTLDVENMGSKDEDDAVVLIKSDKFNLEKAFMDITIDSDDNWRQTYNFKVPDSVIPGEYYVEVWTYYDGDEESDTEVATIKVEKCQSQQQTLECTNFNKATCVSETAFQQCSSTGKLSSIINCQQGYICQSGQCVEKTPIVVTPTLGSGVTGPVYGTDSFFNSKSYLVALVIIVVVLLLIIAILLVKFVF